MPGFVESQSICLVDGMVQSNYYYKNNTKEFTIDYAGKDAVVSRIESVTDVPAGIINDRMKLLQIPTLSEQVMHPQFDASVMLRWHARLTVGTWVVEKMAELHVP